MVNINIPEEPNWIITTLMENGFDAYIVGGCVRDSIIGNTPKDWDICTNAKPEEIKNVFKSSRIIDTGIKHGTVTIVLNNGNYEVTTYRIDGVYSDSRRPDAVLFTDSLKEDLSRRDFTINAMAYNNVVGLVDYFEGQQDLNRKEIRCVGNPNERFNEDALRILRALRFASVLSFVIREETAKAIFKNYELLSKISIERISYEFNKLICGHLVLGVLRAYKDVISYIIPEIKPMIGFNQNNPYHIYDVWQHTLWALQFSPQDLETRLAIFFHDIGKPASYSEFVGIGHFYKHHLYSEEITRNVLKRMKYDNKTIDNVCLLVYNHSVSITDTKKSVKRMLNVVGELFDKLLQVKLSDMYAQSKMSINKKQPVLKNIQNLHQEIIKEEDCFNLKNLAITGKDLISIGYLEGKEIGSKLKQLLDLVIDGEVKNEKEELLQLAIRIK
jgi:tRNA nucleotidyltransferase (CCA-adding enzyme)